MRDRILYKLLGFAATIGAFLQFNSTARAGHDTPTEAPGCPKAADAKCVLDFKMFGNDGKPVELANYRGKVLMVVNVASKCGLTPQYEQLVEIREKYHKQGFEVLAFPANNFLGQEPGGNEEIRAFCTKKYHVKFPLFAKISVKGDDQCELYKFLTSEEKVGKDNAGEIPWNFTKFLIDRDGRVVHRFGPRTKPDAKEVIAAIEQELRKEAPESTEAQPAKDAAG